MRSNKRILPIVILATAGLAGCGTYTADNPMTRDADMKKMAEVQSYARRAGIQVYWINYPQKHEP